MDRYTLRVVARYSLVFVILIILCALGIIGAIVAVWHFKLGFDMLDAAYRDSPLMVALIPAVIVATVQLVSMYVVIRQRHTGSGELDPRKYVAYERLMRDVTMLLRKDEAVLQPRDFLKLTDKHVNTLLLVGSQSVVNYLRYIRDYARHKEVFDCLLLCEQLVTAIRKDMGLKTTEGTGKLITLFQEQSVETIVRRTRGR